MMFHLLIMGIAVLLSMVCLILYIQLPAFDDPRLGNNTLAKFLKNDVHKIAYSKLLSFMIICYH